MPRQAGSCLSCQTLGGTTNTFGSRMSLPDLLSAAAPVAERYLTLLRVHPTRTYNYAARGYFDLPVIEVEQHAPKCKQGESWLYFAVPEAAAISALQQTDRLYVGAQTQDRMFRGDGLDGTNYHHAEMRAGNGSDTPVNFLKTDGRIAIYRARSDRIASQILARPELRHLHALTQQPRTKTKHLGWWMEQYVLFSQAGQWRWNTAKADKSLPTLFAGYRAA